MTTSNITLEEIANSKKFQAIQNYFTADALDLINRSETMKSMVRAYEQSTITREAVLWTGHDGSNPGAAQYRVPAKVIIDDGDKGQLSLGADLISTATGLVDVLSHELGHFVVENPGAIISNARANAWEAKDSEAYAEACHLTEGYARLATAKVVAEINDSTAQSALPENLSRDVRSWSLSTSEYNQYKQLAPVAAQEAWTFDEMDRALAVALGESNKGNTTSTGGETYIQFCARRGNAVYQSGQTAPANAPAATTLGDSADGSSSIETELNDGKTFKSELSPQDALIKTIETAVDELGNVDQTTTTDYTYSDNSADYQTSSTVTDGSGKVVRNSSGGTGGGADGETGGDAGGRLQFAKWLAEIFSVDDPYSGDPFTGLPWPGQSYETLLTNLETRFQQAQTTRSPLVLDLDGDGVETIASSKKGVHFDLDKSGFAEQAGWVGKDDGLLVRDLNGDGKITHGGELFGNHTVLKSGGPARNGFEALKDLDDNNDGRVDAQDSAYASLRVWQDLNSDGITEDGELLTLAQAGVEGLSVSYIEQGADAAKDAQGNQHQQLGTYTRSEGSTQQMHDVWFSVDTARTVNAANEAQWRKTA